MKCFRCDKSLEEAIPGVEQPAGGLIFSSVGNYGSSVYDPMNDRKRLVAYICDACVIERQDVVRKQVTKTQVEHTLTDWKPESEY